MLRTSYHQSGLGPDEYRSVQLSYSTADIERSLFFGDQHEEERPTPSAGEVILLVIHGEYHQLVDEAPPASIKFDEKSSILRLAGEFD